MKIKYVYVRSDNVVNYEFKDDVIKVGYVEYELIMGKAESDTIHFKEIARYEDEFDFKDMPDGRLEMFDEHTGEWLIETELPEIPIVSAERVDGVLWVELVIFFGGDAIDGARELDWFDTKEVELDGENDLENG